MATSPFKNFQNATLTWMIATQWSEELSDTGNPEAAETKTAIVGAKLAEPNKQPTDRLIVGVDENSIQLEGRIVSVIVDDIDTKKLELPTGIQPGAQANIEISGYSGIFTLSPCIQDAYGVSKILGQKIKGMMLITSRWGDLA